MSSKSYWERNCRLKRYKKKNTVILFEILTSSMIPHSLCLQQQANKLVDGTSTPELRRRKLSRRLSSFSSLPNISLIRRKSSTNSNKCSAIKQQASTESETGIFSSFNSSIHSNASCASSSSGSSSFKTDNKKKKNFTPGSLPASVKGVEELIANNISNVNCLVDEGMAGIRRAVINGIDTISLTDGSTAPAEAKCIILWVNSLFSPLLPFSSQLKSVSFLFQQS